MILFSDIGQQNTRKLSLLVISKPKVLKSHPFIRVCRNKVSQVHYTYINKYHVRHFLTYWFLYVCQVMRSEFFSMKMELWELAHGSRAIFSGNNSG